MENQPKHVIFYSQDEWPQGYNNKSPNCGLRVSSAPNGQKSQNLHFYGGKSDRVTVGVAQQQLLFRNNNIQQQ